jgi:hypothetical protein
MVIGQRKSLNLFAGVVKAKYISAGSNAYFG